jgi:hypothetical protein
MPDRDAGSTRGLLMGSAGLRADDWLISGMVCHAICHFVDRALVLDGKKCSEMETELTKPRAAYAEISEGIFQRVLTGETVLAAEVLEFAIPHLGPDSPIVHPVTQQRTEDDRNSKTAA